MKNYINLLSFNPIIIGLLIYSIVSLIAWKKQFTIKNIYFFPFGISTSFFNDRLKILAKKYSPQLQNLGRLSHKIMRKLLLILLISFFIIFNSYRVLKQNSNIPNFIIEIWRYFAFLNYLLPEGSIKFDYFGYYLIIFVSFLVHELLHGLVAEAYEIPIEKIGVSVIPNFLSFAYVAIDLEAIPGKDGKNNDINFPPIINQNKIKPLRKQNEDTLIKGHYLGRIASVGILGNIFLVISSIIGKLIVLVFPNPILHQFFNQMYLVNIYLLILNVIPILGFDGKKILLPFGKIPKFDD